MIFPDLKHHIFLNYDYHFSILERTELPPALISEVRC
jgi:hypothetical protein